MSLSVSLSAPGTELNLPSIDAAHAADADVLQNEANLDEATSARTDPRTDAPPARLPINLTIFTPARTAGPAQENSAGPSNPNPVSSAQQDAEPAEDAPLPAVCAPLG